MDIQEALDFVQAASWLGCRPGLERITDLMHRLGDPQEKLRFVHITGTNGKGSTAAMLAAVLQEAGYRVGLFTSPHLQRYNERIRVNGAEISDEDLCTAASSVKSAIDQMDAVPSEFERFTAMAFLHFYWTNCEIVVLEVGLGGRLDCTNIIPAPEVAVITNIGLDHTEYLGDTIEKIAAEKAGIIKSGADVVLYGQSREAEQVVEEVCRSNGCRLCITDHSQLERRGGDLSGQILRYRRREDIRLRLLGTYQCENAAVALDTLDVLRRRNWTIPEEVIYRGLATVTWPGRFEVLQTEPLVLVDGAHNPNGVGELALCLRTYLPEKKLTLVMGVMADKDYDKMLDLMAPLAKRFITVTPENHRALAADRLRQEIRQRLGLPAQDAKTVPEGIALALRECAPEDAICIFGSLYQVGEVRTFFAQ